MDWSFAANAIWISQMFKTNKVFCIKPLDDEMHQTKTKIKKWYLEL